MKTRPGLAASIAATSLLLAVADACAAPASVFIEGAAAVYTDYYTGTDVPVSGQPFSIKVDLDLANGSVGTDNATYKNVFGSRGCQFVVAGSCVADFGASPPVVTDYSVSTPFAPVGGYRPRPAGDYLGDYTSRLNQSVTGATPMDVYSIERNQRQCTFMSGDRDAYFQDCIDIRFYVYLSTSVNTMFGSLANVMDLDKAPNLGDVPPGYLCFTYISTQQMEFCTTQSSGPCEPVEYSEGSAVWSGVVTSVVAVGGGGGEKPTTKDACKKDGWKRYGFKNQGQCVSYVNHLQ